MMIKGDRLLWWIKKRLSTEEREHNIINHGLHSISYFVGYNSSSLDMTIV